MKIITKIYYIPLPLKILLMAFIITLLSSYTIGSYNYSKNLMSDKGENNINEPFNFGVFKTVFSDSIKSDFKKLTSSNQVNKSAIPEIKITLKKKDLQKLENIKNKKSLKAKLEYLNKPLNIKVKLKGKKNWDKIEKKKSLSIKLTKNKLYNGNEQFLLINPRKEFLIDRAIYFNLIKEIGLLGTKSSFAKLFINELNIGVFHYETAIEDSLFIENKRIKGNVYDLKNKYKDSHNSNSWTKEKNWQKLISIKKNNQDLKVFLENVNKEISVFSDYAFKYIDLEKFAALEAINLIFGNDKKNNFALYFDPYKGLLEPIINDFGGFKANTNLKTKTNYLFQKLHKLPMYLNLRNEFIHKFINKEISANKFNNKISNLLNLLKADLSHDYNWKSVKQPDISNPFYKQIMRPMNFKKLEEIADSELKKYQKRLSNIKKSIDKPLTINNKVTKVRKIILGPKEVKVTKTKYFSENTEVEILPGTKFLMSKKTSLIFRGKVNFNGNKEKPIIIESLNKKRWGGIAIQGEKSSGSILNYVDISGGTYPQDKNIYYPGMVNFHNTKNIIIKNSIFSDNKKSDDVLHIVYSDNLKISNLLFKDSNQDGLDIEFSKGNVEKAKTLKAGDDCLDLMGSNLNIIDSIFIKCKGKGVSVGEKSTVKIKNLIVTKSNVGLFNKDKSSINLSNALLYENKLGIKYLKQNINYSGKSQFIIKELYLYNNSENIIKDNSEKIAFNSLDNKSKLPYFLSSFNLKSYSDLKQLALSGGKIE